MKYKITLIILINIIFLSFSFQSENKSISNDDFKIIYNSKKYLVINQNKRISTTVDSLKEHLNKEGVLGIYVPKELPTLKNDAVPLFIYTSGNFPRIILNNDSKPLHTGSNFLFVDFTFIKGENKIPFTTYINKDSICGTIDFTY